MSLFRRFSPENWKDRQYLATLIRLNLFKLKDKAKMSKFITELETRDIDDNKVVLLSDLVYESDLLKTTITVPKGFISDKASVPRVPIAYMAFGDRAHRESVVHDLIYKEGKIPRRKADAIFLEAMKARNKKWWIRSCMWLGVRLGGWIAWRQHRRNEKGGNSNA